MRDEPAKCFVFSLSGALLGLALTGCSSDTPSESAGTSGSSSTAGSSAGGNSASAGNTSSGSASGGNTTGGGAASADCDAAGLTWKSANKTWYESYPDPGSEECIKYNGCMWAGQFQACDGTKPKEWVSAHNIVSAFPDFDSLQLHDLCLKSGDKTIVVTVLDTCADSDCSGCCTQNQGNADELIDIESFTNDRFGVDDGPIQWADLGPTQGAGCD